MMRAIGSLMLFLVCTLALAPTVQAALMFEFANSAGVPQSDFSISAAGGTAEIQLYLRQTAPDMILSTEGLLSAGVELSYNGAVAHVANAGAVAPNLDFDVLADVSFPDANSVGLDLLSSTGVTAVGDRILLGTFTFTGLSNGIMSLSTADLTPVSGVDNTISVGGTVLDELIANATATLQVGDVEVVPEPSSQLVFGVCLAIGGLACWLRSKRRQAA